MLVRADRRAQPQLVLLDHGLYKQLPDALRLEYAGLWQALVFGDEAVSDSFSHIVSLSCMPCRSYVRSLPTWKQHGLIAGVTCCKPTQIVGRLLCRG